MLPSVRVARDLTFFNRVWPADLNRDGITDLVSSAPATCSGSSCTPNGQLQVALGRGDGTFAAPVVSSFVGAVLGVGDFNGDSRIDVIGLGNAPSGDLVILPGTGSATLGAPVPVGVRVFEDFPFAASADLNGDGKRDLVINGPRIYPGNGDFTFGEPVALFTDNSADAIIADVNSDGRGDLLVAGFYSQGVSVFLNRGGFVFSSNDIPLGHGVTDVTVADVNRDGRVDLLASAGKAQTIFGPGEGFVFVIRGNGNGTFQAPSQYVVPDGPTQIVAIDWNRDGITDIATGNRSAIARDDCADTWKTWDSVSILLGSATGTFAAPSNFSVGDQSLVDPENRETGRYKNTLTSLNTSDLNRDGRTDLIVSNGAIVFSVPAVANRPPVADFGPDQVILNTHETVLRPRATDPDQDLLSWVIRDDGGNVIAGHPNACWTGLHDGPNTFTVTVDDGHGHSDSDTVVLTVRSGDGGSGEFSPGTDIGAVGAAGTDTFNSDTGQYTIQGSGADIWGTADEFRYVATQLTGDFTIGAFVNSVQNIHAWTKAGLMVRENLTAGSRHASVFATPGKGVAFQNRPTTNGESVSASTAGITAPVMVLLSRRGDVIRAYWRKDIGQFWTLIGQQTLPSLPQTVYAGLAVTSHQDGTLARAEFSEVRIEQTVWTGQAIGTGTGSATQDGVVFNVSGRGADIWGTSDAFYYVHTPMSGRFTLTARVRSISNTNAWAKAGVMIRETLSPGAKHAFALVSAAKGVTLQYRAATGGASAGAGTIAGAAAPGWVQIVRNGDRIDAFWSTNGFEWAPIGNVNIPMADSVFIGLPVTSHNTAATATAVFDDVKITPF